MADDLTQGLGIDPEEMQRRARLQGALGMSDSAVGPPPTPRIPSPSANDKTPPVTLRGISPQAQQRTSDSESELSRLQSTGSGISQIQDPTGRRILKTLDTIGSIAAPNLMRSIPGTELHHQGLLGQQREMLGQDLGNESTEAGIGEKQAQTGATQETTAEMPQKLKLEQQREEDARAPKPKEEKWSEFANFTDTDGTPLVREENSGQVVRANDKKPPTGFKPSKPTTDKPDSPEQQFIDAETAKGVPLQQAIADYAKASRQPPQEPGSYMPLYDEHGKVTGAWNAKTGHIAQAPQNMPGTTSQGAGIGSKADAVVKKESQPYQQMIDTAAEGHKLAEMAGQGNASADVDLVLSFFKMMKGTGGSGVKFTKQEQDLILGARSAGQGLEAIGQKVIGEGQPLTPEQRGHMVSVMDMHAKAAQQHLANMQGGQGTPAPAETPQPKSGVPTFAEWKAQQQHP